jgi:hypothetical protein
MSETTQIIKLDDTPLEYITTRENCDACGAQAYYRVTFDAGHLFFCRHHYIKQEEAFFEKALDIVDESELL